MPGKLIADQANLNQNATGTGSTIASSADATKAIYDIAVSSNSVISGDFNIPPLTNDITIDDNTYYTLTWDYLEEWWKIVTKAPANGFVLSFYFALARGGGWTHHDDDEPIVSPTTFWINNNANSPPGGAAKYNGSNPNKMNGWIAITDNTTPTDPITIYEQLGYALECIDNIVVYWEYGKLPTLSKQKKGVR